MSRPASTATSASNLGRAPLFAKVDTEQERRAESMADTSYNSESLSQIEIRSIDYVLPEERHGTIRDQFTLFLWALDFGFLAAQLVALWPYLLLSACAARTGRRRAPRGGGFSVASCG
jgi:hypothetical protein